MLLVPVVVELVDVALCIVLLDLAKSSELPIELGLQGLRTIEGLGRAKDIPSVLLVGSQLILKTLLPKVLLVLQVAVAKVRRVGCKAVGQGLLRLLLGLSHGRTTESSTLGELRCQLGNGTLVIGGRRVLVGLSNDLIEVAAAGVRVVLGVDVVGASEDAV